MRAITINIVLIILSLPCLAGYSQQLSSEPWLLARHSHLPLTTARPRLLPVDCLHCLTDNQQLTTVPLMALYWYVNVTNTMCALHCVRYIAKSLDHVAYM